LKIAKVRYHVYLKEICKIYSSSNIIRNKN
jgi:hypothetical protein